MKLVTKARSAAKGFEVLTGISPRYVLLGVVFALLGMLLAGCDGQGYEVEVDGGATDALRPDATPATGSVKHLDNGAAYCDVPSPTGDDPGAAVVDGRRLTVREVAMRSATLGSPVAFVVVANAQDAGKLCSSFDARRVYSADAVTCEDKLKSFGVETSECSVSMTAAQCGDAAHDFADSAGVKHCFTLVAADGVTTCRPDVSGTKECMLKSFDILGVGSDPKRVALCSEKGDFVGWQCS